MVEVFQKVEYWYQKHERPISSLSLIGGFVFDAVTLRRVDQFWDNFWVVLHLLIVALAIIFIHRIDREKVERRFWLVNIMQFFFGGLLSTFLVFYFRAGSLEASWPFLCILAIAFIANERLKNHYERLTFQIGFLFLSIFLFTIFLVPVIVHAIGPTIFVASGAVSLVLLALFLFLLKKLAHEEYMRSRKMVFVSIGSIFLILNTLYFANIIPPIPLSLEAGGIYHSVTRLANGDYALQGESQNWWDVFSLSQTVHDTGAPLYAFTSVYSPANLNTEIVHEWQYQDGENWQTISEIYLSVVGGRDQGYRTYSQVQVTPGKWRVNVKTPEGQLIGRISFTVVS